MTYVLIFRVTKLAQPCHQERLRRGTSSHRGLREGATGQDTYSRYSVTCCARATNGHAAAPPSPAMNSRRRIHPSQKDALG